ncbi:MAG: hypothetical protein PHD95_05125 [Candidatus ainarchaeum sp.]|nr:hypothetical protein [Candidatus ainarchaeum sp.]
MDAHGIVRTFPGKSERMTTGIERKIAAQHAHAKRIEVPKTLPRHTVVTVLKQMGFEQRGINFFHTNFCRVMIPKKASAVTVNVIKNRNLRRVIEAFLRNHGKL